MKKIKLIVFLFTVVILSIGICINVLYNNMDNVSTETKVRILLHDVHNSESIFTNNNFDVKTDDFVFEGTVLTDLSYVSNDLLYKIECTTNDCAIMAKKSLDVEFWVNILGNNYSVGYNSDTTLYSNDYINGVEDIFLKKINTVYKEYTEATYNDIHRNKIHYFYEYLYNKMKL